MCSSSPLGIPLVRRAGRGLRALDPTLAALLQAILEQHLRLGAARTVIQLGRVNRDGILHLLEQVLVIHDVTKILVIPIETVRAADSLEEAMILHALVDIEEGAAWSIESGEEFVHYDQELHVGGLFLEQFLG